MSAPAMAVASIDLTPVSAVRETRTTVMLQAPGTAVDDLLNVALAVIAVLLFAVVVRRRGPTTTA
ncbi:hypothetical protein GCM10011529_13860 [Polymorphobacter glacialis]|uniref:Uncharacterized protein n=2 Tax=Sandarakinorhabdus glacialis TaxID=1614636 RepID=A0A917E6A7_9SPHN|nr:hypothetical protein GCM10011529_13860 [Polymorphobacter glacialis]